MAEITFLASALHWPLSTLLDIEHADRHHLIDLVSNHDLTNASPADPMLPGTVG